MTIVVFVRLRIPKSRRAKKVCIAGDAARKRKPLLDVRPEYVVLKRKIHSRVCRSSRNDSRQTRRKLLKDCPLIKSRVRAAPHRHFSVAIRLLREPFDDVVAVL